MSHGSTDPLPLIKAHLPQSREGRKLLDLACGNGRHSRLALERGYQATAVDRDVTVVSKLERPGLIIIQADLENASWPFADQSFDAIIVTNYLHRPLFPYIRDTLKPGGLLLYETFAVGNKKYGRPSNPDFLLKENELQEVFSEDFEEKLFEQIDDDSSVKQRFVASKH